MVRKILVALLAAPVQSFVHHPPREVMTKMRLVSFLSL